MKRRHSGAVVSAAFLLVLGGSQAVLALGKDCGGTVACGCGDRVTSDYVMAEDLGPCPRVGDGAIGLSIASGVALDCVGHTIRGPADKRREEFGIRMGARSQAVSGITVRNCSITGFWWGIYVRNARDVLIENNQLFANGWKDKTQNGTGYGLDVVDSRNVVVRGNTVDDNGNEGIHLSHSSHLLIEDNVLADNGWEQLYLYYARDNEIAGNLASGGRQGLEMRWSSGNLFSNNVWAGSRKQWLENDSPDNRFVYDHFEGVLLVAKRSKGNRFDLCHFQNPAGWCVRLRARNNYLYKAHFGTCRKKLRSGLYLWPARRTVLDRSLGPEAIKKHKRYITFIYPGCTADVDGDGTVDAADVSIVEAAMGSAVGDPAWNPEADLDHDGDVDADDAAKVDRQLGPCG